MTGVPTNQLLGFYSNDRNDWFTLPSPCLVPSFTSTFSWFPYSLFLSLVPVQNSSYKIRNGLGTNMFDTEVQHQRHRTRHIREVTSQLDVPTSLTPSPSHLLCFYFVGLFVIWVVKCHILQPLCHLWQPLWHLTMVVKCDIWLSSSPSTEDDGDGPGCEDEVEEVNIRSRWRCQTHFFWDSR